LQNILSVHEDNVTVVEEGYINKTDYWSGTIDKDQYPMGVYKGGELDQASFSRGAGEGYIRCVRNSSADEIGIRKEANALVVEPHNLWIQNDDRPLEKPTDWLSALNICEELVLEGYDDWRLPNVNELLYLEHLDDFEGGIAFKHTEESYWSSTTDLTRVFDPYDKQGLAVHIVIDDTLWSVKKYGHEFSKDVYDCIPAVRCVRGGQMQEK
jgi:hypothetical protein